MTTAIESFTTNLSSKIKTNPDKYVVIGREEETRKVMESLQRRTKNSPVLVGEPGVGKTAVVEGLAKKIIEGAVPERLKDVDVLTLEVASLQGENFTKNFEQLISELTNQRNKYILFIDEVHTIMGAGSNRGLLDMSNLLKPSLARGDFRVISATTSDEYHEYIEPDAALERRFQQVMVNEPSDDEAEVIMLGLKKSFEDFYGMVIADQAIKDSIYLSKRYINQHFLPDKAIDLLEGTAARLSLSGKQTLNSKDVLDQVQEVTGIPTETLSKSGVQRALELSKVLSKRVIGQIRATNTISRKVQKVAVGHNDPKRPLAVEFLLGPTGTGKTELVKTMASVLFNSEENILRFDMSEFIGAGAVDKFIERATAGIIKNPYTIVLMDEIEKASPAVFDLLLQVFQDGVLTDKRGKTAVFRNAYIIMTSNEGFKFINDQMKYGGLPEGDFDVTKRDIEKGIKKELQNRFRPELINRIDDIVMFNQLSTDAIQTITKKQLDRYASMVKNKNKWKITYTDDVVSFIADTAYDPENGARPVQRTINDLVDDVVSKQVLKYQIKNPNAIFEIHMTIAKDESLNLAENSIYDPRKIKFGIRPINHFV